MNKNIGAVIIDTYPDKKMPSIAIEHILKLNFINKIYFLSNECSNLEVEFIKIPSIDCARTYSDIVLYQLTEHTNEDHILIFQWDGFSIHPEVWTPNFLQYDYIGAPIYLPNNEVWIGNGGFSLRSRRLLDYLSKEKFQILEISNDESAEDQVICTHARKLLEKQGFLFPKLNIASKFSYQNSPSRDQSFGFHGIHNFPYFLSESKLLEVSNEIFARKNHPQFTIEFFANCLQQGMLDLFRSCLMNFSKNRNLYDALLWDKGRNPNHNLLDFIIQNKIIPLN
jgi:hypothetical protein